jgi:hypothetical protein
MRVAGLLALSSLTACQTGTIGNTLGSARDATTAKDDDLNADDLRAFCPRVTLREGTAILRTFTKNNDDNPDEIVFQATISDVTRTCKYRDGLLYMTVAAAGRVVNGPKGTAGNLELPLRVAVSRGESVPYTNLGKINVAVIPGAGATQFIYKDENVTVPGNSPRSLQVFVGFDEGPYNTP